MVKKSILFILFILSIPPARAQNSTNKTFVVRTNNILNSDATNFFATNIMLLTNALTNVGFGLGGGGGFTGNPTQFSVSGGYTNIASGVSLTNVDIIGSGATAALSVAAGTGDILHLKSSGGVTDFSFNSGGFSWFAGAYSGDDLGDVSLGGALSAVGQYWAGAETNAQTFITNAGICTNWFGPNVMPLTNSAHHFGLDSNGLYSGNGGGLTNLNMAVGAGNGGLSLSGRANGTATISFTNVPPGFGGTGNTFTNLSLYGTFTPGGTNPPSGYVLTASDGSGHSAFMAATGYFANGLTNTGANGLTNTGALTNGGAIYALTNLYALGNITGAPGEQGQNWLSLNTNNDGVSGEWWLGTYYEGAAGENMHTDAQGNIVFQTVSNYAAGLGFNGPVVGGALILPTGFGNIITKQTNASAVVFYGSTNGNSSFQELTDFLPISFAQYYGNDFIVVSATSNIANTRIEADATFHLPGLRLNETNITGLTTFNANMYDTIILCNPTGPGNTTVNLPSEAAQGNVLPNPGQFFRPWTADNGYVDGGSPPLEPQQTTMEYWVKNLGSNTGNTLTVNLPFAATNIGATSVVIPNQMSAHFTCTGTTGGTAIAVEFSPMTFAPTYNLVNCTNLSGANVTGVLTNSINQPAGATCVLLGTTLSAAGLADYVSYSLHLHAMPTFALCSNAMAVMTTPGAGYAQLPGASDFSANYYLTNGNLSVTNIVGNILGTNTFNTPFNNTNYGVQITAFANAATGVRSFCFGTPYFIPTNITVAGFTIMQEASMPNLLGANGVIGINISITGGN